MEGKLAMIFSDGTFQIQLTFIQNSAPSGKLPETESLFSVVCVKDWKHGEFSYINQV